MVKPKTKKSSKAKPKQKPKGKKKSAPTKASGKAAKKTKAAGASAKAGQKTKKKVGAKPSPKAAKAKKSAAPKPRTTAKASPTRTKNKKPAARKPAPPRPPEQHEGSNGDQQELDAGWASSADTIVDEVIHIGSSEVTRPPVEHREEVRPAGGFGGGIVDGGSGFGIGRDSFGGNGEPAAAEDEDEELPSAVSADDEDEELHAVDEEE